MYCNANKLHTETILDPETILKQVQHKVQDDRGVGSAQGSG